MGKGLAEQLGAVDSKGRGFGLDRGDIGTDVTGYIEKDNKPENMPRRILPKGHRFFHDCERETNTRLIEHMMSGKGMESWFVTLTFKNYVGEFKARGMVASWLGSLSMSYRDRLQEEGKDCRSHGLNWVIAQEWQKRQVIHFHIILSGVRLGTAMSRKTWECRWSGMGGGFARVHDASPKAAPYLAKYTGKTYHDGAIWWGGTWRRDTPLDSLRCCKA